MYCVKLKVEKFRKFFYFQPIHKIVPLQINLHKNVIVNMQFFKLGVKK